MSRIAFPLIVVFVLFSQQVQADPKPKPAPRDKSGIKATIKDLKDQIGALQKARRDAIEETKRKYNALMASKGGVDEKRAAELAELQQQMSDALDKADAAFRTAATNLKAADAKLRVERDTMAASRDAEVAKAKSSADQTTIWNSYKPKLEALDSQIDANKQALAELHAKHDAEINQTKAAFNSKIGALGGKNRVDHDKIMALCHEKDAEVDKTKAHFDGQIGALKEKLAGLEKQLKKK